MDVRLPDGTIIRNVPEGTTRAQIEAKYARAFAKPETPASPTEDMSGAERFAAGMGKAFTDLATGVPQFIAEGVTAGSPLGAIRNIVNLAREPDIEDVVRGQQKPFEYPWIEALRQKAAEKQALDQPLMETGAGLAGNVVGNLIGITAPAAAAGRVPGLAAAGRAMLSPSTATQALAGGAVAGAVQPAATPSDRALNIGLGAGGSLAGYGLAKGISGLVRPGTSNLNPQQQAVVARASELGIPFTPAERSGSRAAQIVEAGLTRTPGGTKPFQQFNMSRQKIVNQLALKELGEQGDVITREALDSAAERFGSAYNALRGVKEVPLDEQFAASVREIAETYADRAPQLQSSGVIDLLENYADDAGKGSISGRRLVADMKALRKQATDAFRSGNSDMGQVKQQLAEALEQTAERTLTGPELANFQAARQGFAKLFAVEKAADLNTGNLSMAKLGTALARQSPKTYGSKGTTLETIGMVGQGFKPIPTSGTAEGMQLPLLASAAMVDPMALMGAYVGPRVASNAYLRSPGVYPGIKSLMPTTARQKAIAEALRQGLQAGALTLPATANP